MHTVFLVHVDPGTRELLEKARAELPGLRFEAAGALDEVLSRLEGVGALVLGAGLREPLQAVETLRGLCPSVPVLLLTDPGCRKGLEAALKGAAGSGSG